jgi:hypothetical protein
MASRTFSLLTAPVGDVQKDRFNFKLKFTDLGYHCLFRPIRKKVWFDGKIPRYSNLLGYTTYWSYESGVKHVISPTNQRVSETTDICYVSHEFQL